MRSSLYSNVDIDVMSSPPDLPIAWCGEHRIIGTSELENTPYLPIAEPEIFAVHWNALILNLPSNTQDAVLTRIRQSDKWIRPVFTIGESALSPFLADGKPPEDIENYLNNFNKRKTRLQSTDIDEISQRIAAYLYARPEFTLAPKFAPIQDSRYYYPLTSLWEARNNTIDLDKLRKSGVLAIDQLIDRIRLCGFCESAQLNYVDICPQCKSINLQTSVAVHCFNCGHVDEQEYFLNHDSMHCPNCMTRLRHIGVDYDRPLETLKCMDCDSRFIEGEVVAQCYKCQSKNDTSSLLQRRIVSYRLGDLGRHLATNGHASAVLTQSWGQAIAPPQFAWILTWLTHSALQDGGKHTILSVQIHDSGADATVHGVRSQHRSNLLEELESRICSIIRTTDILTHYSQSCFLILFPNIERSSLINIQTGIEKLQDVSKFVISLDSKTIPDEIPQKNVDRWLLNWLNREPSRHE